MFHKVFCFLSTGLLGLALVTGLLPGPAVSAASTPGLMGWQQANVSGFGDPTNQGAMSMAVFNNQLYAGAGNWDGAGASVWRTSDGLNWSPAMTEGFGSPDANAAIVGMFAFKGKLYAGAGWGGVPHGAIGQLWRTSDGTTWSHVTGNGIDVTPGPLGAFGVYGDTLYAGTCGNAGTSGAQIWRSTTGDSMTWTTVVTGGLTTTDNDCVTSLSTFNGALYAAVENQVSGAQIWRSTAGNSGSWTQVNTSGFGSGDDLTGGFAIYDGYLYIGTRGGMGQAALWRSDNGTNWSPVTVDGFGDFYNWKLESLFVFNGTLYAALNNVMTGLEVWRTNNGTTWSRANPDGFGDSNNQSTLWSNETVAFNGSLYMGVFNSVHGLEIWRWLPIEGYHDGTEGATDSLGCVAEGWAVDPDDPNRDLQIQIFSDGDLLTTTTANLLRPDVTACTGGTCGFNIDLWGLISPGQAHQITVRAYDEETSTWLGLFSTPKTLTCWGYPEGFHDANQGLVDVNSCYADGWAVDPDNPNRDLQVRVLADGNPVAITTANLLREDVTACTRGTCGFLVDLGGLISLGVQHELTVQAYDEESQAWRNLSETPKLLTCQPQSFGDVSPTYWAWSFVERLYKVGITGGCGTSPLRYCPENTVTRAQMAVFLLRGIHGASYAPPGVGPGTGFGDVPPSYWSATFIKQLAAEGITTGCGNGNYCPEQPVTRAQMAVFLLRSKHGASYAPPGAGAGTGFGDVPPNYWAAAWIKQLVAEGITAGCGNGNYCPEQPVTRAQMAVFLVRTFSLP